MNTDIRTRNWFGRTFGLLLLTFAVGCGSEQPQRRATSNSASTTPVSVMKLTSSGFENGGMLDAKYTVEGQDISPPFSWREAPPGTKSFALICDDPDAPSPRRPAAQPWVHWVIFNIPPDRFDLPQGIHPSPEPEEPPGSRQGKNSWTADNIGYRGPAPPPGSGPHRYFFKLYALDSMFELHAGATKQQLAEAMSGHILAEGQLFGIYER